jgi:hypothetical protein
MKRSHIPVEPGPVTLDDLEVVLTRVLSRTDGHARDDGDAETWFLAARSGRWTRAEVAAATMTISRTFTGFRVMPGHMTEQIAADRATISKRWYCPDPPRTLRDDPAAEIAWRRRTLADFAERALLALATGEPLEDVPLVLIPEPEPRAALPAAEMARRVEQATAEVGERHAIGRSVRDEDLPARRVTLDPEVRRQVREDLEHRRSAPMPEPGHEQAS